LGLIKGPSKSEITLDNVPQLVQNSACKVHADFFRWAGFRDLETDSDDSNDSQDSHDSGETLHWLITNTDGIITFYRTKGDYQHVSRYVDLLITSNGGSIHDSKGIGRIVDRKWIDTDLIKTWKTSCASDHGLKCSSESNIGSYYSDFPRPPLPLLIDTVEECLVDGTDKASYVCLSYVWGKPIAGQETIKTTTETLHKFRQPKAFGSPDGVLLPRTIRDAMSVTHLLGERYLWVDALCIVQDDDTVHYSLINSMHAIYANAAVTIIAADGADADAGLRGIRGLSSLPRDNPCVFEWPDGTTLNLPGKGGLASTIWNERGWTFQEYLFSRKRLIFVADSVRWECPHGSFWEEHTDQVQMPTNDSHSAYDTDNVPIRRTIGNTSAIFPDMLAFKTLVDGFNSRQFTYPDDVMDGFAGVLSALAPAFLGGFIWGVPVMYLDLALTWRARLNVSFCLSFSYLLLFSDED
jgi:hypothetical protein